MTRPATTSPPAVDQAELAYALNMVRPLLKGHGGDLEVTEVDEGVLCVTFRGVCESCPAIAVTFAGLVRTHLLNVDGVREVRTDQVHASPQALDRIAAALAGSAPGNRLGK